MASLGIPDSTLRKLSPPTHANDPQTSGKRLSWRPHHARTHTTASAQQRKWKGLARGGGVLCAAHHPLGVLGERLSLMRGGQSLVHDAKGERLGHVQLLALEGLARRARRAPLVFARARKLHRAHRRLRVPQQSGAEVDHAVDAADALRGGGGADDVGQLVEEHLPDG
eukprot:3748432-Pleurochrysis_carterae.AAC.2